MSSSGESLQEQSVSPNKQVFIIGSRRSGTTWTLWLLANHPEIVGVQHTNLIDAFKKLDKWWLDKEKIHSSIVNGIDEKVTANLKDFVTAEDFYGHCRRLAEMMFAQALNEKKQASVVVETQPENIANLELLEKLFPDAYYLNVIRDPRSVFSSWKTVATTWSSPDVFNTHPVGFSKRWRKDVQSGREFSRRFKNYKEIKYEDLKSDGVELVRSVYDWLGVDADYSLAEQAIDACEMQKLRKKGNMPRGFFRKGQKEGWKSELSSEEIMTIEYCLSDLMDDLNYERVNKGQIPKTSIFRYYELKKRLSSWLRNSKLLEPLREIKHSLLG